MTVIFPMHTENLHLQSHRTYSITKIVDSRTTISQGIELLQRFKAAGYKLYVLSNWDAQSFPIMKNQYREIFDLFDGIITSGEAQCLKPNPEIFEVLKKKMKDDNIKANDCLFLDDEQHNIDGAKKQRIDGIVFERKNMTATLNRLQDKGVLTINA